MATTPNQKPVPSEDYANMRFNAGKFDEFMTSTASSYVDRLGITHLTVTGIQASVTGALLPANNLSDVQSAATSRVNLGLGTVAVESIVPITKGGTGATNATAAMSNLFGMPLIQAFSNVDVNTLTSNGLYSIPSTATNIPVSSLGVLEVYMRFGGNQYCQEFNVLTSSVNRKFFRSGVSGTWTAWKEVAAAGANSDITSLTGLTTALSIAQGGTGATTATTALTALGAKANAGVTNASVAAAGVVGQVITATGTATTMTTGTQADILTMTLTAGDWDLDAAIRIAPTGTTITQVVASTATTALATAVFPNRLIFGFNSQASIEMPFPTKTVNISATTTIYLSLSIAFSGGSATGQGYMSARRVR